MASFIAKQMLGSQLDSVKGALGDKKDEESKGDSKEIDPEVEQALREAEERRKEKHRKMEEERETMRQGIRDKYGIKKKEELLPEEFGMGAAGDENRVGRKRKTPGELAAEAAAAEEAEDSITNMLPESMRDTANKMMEGPGKLVNEAQEKCSVM